MNITLPSQYNFSSRFFQLATVNAVSNMMIPLAGAIGVGFLGHLPNIDYLAGVALGTILLEYLYDTCSFIRSGTTTIASQATGRDDEEAVLLAGLQNGLIALGLGSLILLLQTPIREVGFTLLSATPEVKLAGIAYFNSRIWSAPAALVDFVLVGWFLGREKKGAVLLLTVVGNAANIVLNYLFIVQWDWSSAGAGLSQAISQYLTLAIGLAMIALEIPLQDISRLTGKIFDFSTFQSIFSLNYNLFIRSMVIVSTFTLFTTIGTTMGTGVIAENALLMQITGVSMWICSGTGYAIATLSGNFKGQGSHHQFAPLLQVGIGTNLGFCLIVGLATVCFPEPILQLLTNHTDLIETAKIHAPWLTLVLGGAGVASILDGYFTGLSEGTTLRNAYLINGFLGFLPLGLLAFYLQSNHMLWSALSIFMLARIVTLGASIPMTLALQSKEPAMNS